MKRKFVCTILFLALCLTACGSHNNFEKDNKPDSISSIQYDDTKVNEIGLSISIGNISRTSAELSFKQHDGNPKGDLEYGEDFIIEKIENGIWIEVPIVVEGDYGFDDIAHQIVKEGVTDFEINWEWLYGELEPGEYRIGKGVIDFVETGSYDKYMISGHFIIN